MALRFLWRDAEATKAGCPASRRFVGIATREFAARNPAEEAFRLGIRQAIHFRSPQATRISDVCHFLDLVPLMDAQGAGRAREVPDRPFSAETQSKSDLKRCPVSTVALPRRSHSGLMFSRQWPSKTISMQRSTSPTCFCFGEHAAEQHRTLDAVHRQISIGIYSVEALDLIVLTLIRRSYGLWVWQRLALAKARPRLVISYALVSPLGKCSTG